MKLKINKLFFQISSNIIIIIILTVMGIFTFLNNGSMVFNKDLISAYYCGDENKNNVSIMINVYWGTEYIDEMLDILDKYNVKATFFVGGLWVSKEPEKLLKIYERGHEIGNHGFYHKSQDKLSYKDNKSEIENNHKIVKEYLKIDMNLFAPPSGAYSNTTLKVADELGYKTIMWSKDTIDWRDQDKDLIIKRASTKNKNGDLILMHPTKATKEALSTIIDNILQQNFKIVKVSENISSNIV